MVLDEADQPELSGVRASIVRRSRRTGMERRDRRKVDDYRQVGSQPNRRECPWASESEKPLRLQGKGNGRSEVTHVDDPSVRIEVGGLTF